jgi:hypothetical protein
MFLLPGGATVVTATLLDTTNCYFRVRADTNVTESSGVTDWDDTGDGSLGGGLDEATNKPALVAAQINGQPVIRFDGSNDELTHNGSFSLSAPQYVMTLMNQVSWTVNDRIMSDANEDPNIAQKETGRNINMTNDSGGAEVTPPANGTYFLLISYMSGSNSYQQVNEGSKSTITTADLTWSGLRLGRGGTSFANIEVAELVFFTAEVTGSQLTQNLAYFSERYGVF